MTNRRLPKGQVLVNRPIPKNYNICEEYNCHVDDFLSPQGKFNSGLMYARLQCSPNDTQCHNMYQSIGGDNAFVEMKPPESHSSCNPACVEWWTTVNNGQSDGGAPLNVITHLHPGLTYRLIDFFPAEGDGVIEFCHSGMGCTGFDNGTGMNFGTGGQYDQLTGDLIAPYLEFTLPNTTSIKNKPASPLGHGGSIGQTPIQQRPMSSFKRIQKIKNRKKI